MPGHCAQRTLRRWPRTKPQRPAISSRRLAQPRPTVAAVKIDNCCKQLLRAGVAVLLAGIASLAQAEASVIDEAAPQIRALGERAASAWPDGKARIEVEPGQLDPRLRLAPCEQIEAYLPPNARAWGRTRVGLRCVSGPSPWNVYLPVTVHVFAPAWVAAEPLPAGTQLQAAMLVEAEIDWAADNSPAFAAPAALLGQVLSRALAAGQPPRQRDLKQRQWFAAGDTVQVIARGAGFSVSGAGLALAAGIDGHSVRVRTASGRVLSGRAIAANRVEVQL